MLMRKRIIVDMTLNEETGVYEQAPPLVMFTYPPPFEKGGIDTKEEAGEPVINVRYKPKMAADLFNDLMGMSKAMRDGW